MFLNLKTMNSTQGRKSKERAKPRRVPANRKGGHRDSLPLRVRNFKLAHGSLCVYTALNALCSIIHIKRSKRLPKRTAALVTNILTAEIMAALLVLPALYLCLKLAQTHLRKSRRAFTALRLLTLQLLLSVLAAAEIFIYKQLHQPQRIYQLLLIFGLASMLEYSDLGGPCCTV
jgi:hypothetical protein